MLPYLDIPSSTRAAAILKLMRRPAPPRTPWRIPPGARTSRADAAQHLHRRFSGRDGGEFEELLEWLREAQLDRVGCFEYSPVEGAAANALPECRCPDEVKQERRERFMQLAAADQRGAALKRRSAVMIRVLVDRRWTVSPARARRAMRRKSTAWCVFPRPCKLKVGDFARGPRSRGPAPTISRRARSVSCVSFPSIRIQRGVATVQIAADSFGL